MNRFSFVLIFILALSANRVYADGGDKYVDSYNFIRGMELLREEGPDSEKGIEYLKEEIKLHPKNGMAYYWLEVSKNETGDYGEALTYADLAVKYVKDKEILADAFCTRAQIYIALDDVDAAMKDWELALKAKPKNKDVYAARANYFYQVGDYDSSDANWLVFRKLFPNETAGYCGVGRNEIARENYESAAELLDYCVRLDPHDAQLYAFRAQANYELKNYSLAADDIITAIGINYHPKATTLMLNFRKPEADIMIAKLKAKMNQDGHESEWPMDIGFLYGRKGNYPEALKYCQKALDTDEKANAVIYYNMATYYGELGLYDKAIECCDKYLSECPDDTDGIKQKAIILYNKGDVQGSIEILDNYLELEPDNPYGYYQRGFVYDDIQEVDDAIRDYSMAVSLDPEFAYAYLGRADMYHLKGEDKLAEEDYRKVVELDTLYSDNSCTQYALLALGERNEAVVFMDSIIAYNSDDSGIYYNAACLYARMGETDKSLEYLRTSLEKGYTCFAHIDRDDDMNSLKDLEQYKTMIAEYKARQQQVGSDYNYADGKTDSELREYVTNVPFTKDAGGTYSVPCTINGLPLNFCFDTGCSDVSISQVEATFMMKNGYLDERDFAGSNRYVDANGNISEGTVIYLKEVKFGELSLRNVRASVVRNQKAPLLLGQTVLSRAGKVEIDYEKNNLVITYKK